MSGSLIVVIVLVILGLLLIGIYNRLVALRQTTNQAFSDIDVQLKQRHDLIPNLVETVKGYAAHERGALEDVTAARSAALSAHGVEAQGAAESALTASLGRLLALAEAYPNLRANENFQHLQSELADVENKIAAARRFFNNAVSEYNTAVQQFPASVFAGGFGFSARTFFDVGPERGAIDVTPNVKF